MQRPGRRRRVAAVVRVRFTAAAFSRSRRRLVRRARSGLAAGAGTGCGPESGDARRKLENRLRPPARGSRSQEQKESGFKSPTAHKARAGSRHDRPDPRAGKALDRESLQGQRDLAILPLGFSGAFRRSELAALYVADPDLNGRGLIGVLGPRRAVQARGSRGLRISDGGVG